LGRYFLYYTLTDYPEAITGIVSKTAILKSMTYKKFNYFSPPKRIYTLATTVYLSK